jgi:D-aminopeptidase
MVSVNPVVGETNDGHLSDIRARPITEAHVLEATLSATNGPVAEGCVGAGTGTTALGFKAGIGTASRIVPIDGSSQPVTLGALVQANFGGTLNVVGVPILETEALTGLEGDIEPRVEPEGNSCMIVVATDAPLESRQLTRLAARAVFAMGRVGASYSHGSGDYGIAFSVGEGSSVNGRSLDPLFAAVQEAVEEALLNALFMAETTVGYRGRVAHAVPLEFVRRRLSLR